MCEGEKGGCVYVSGECVRVGRGMCVSGECEGGERWMCVLRSVSVKRRGNTYMK